MKMRTARSLVAKIGLVFVFMAAVFSAMLLVLVRESIIWAEDNMAMRHLKANEQPALAKYLTGADGPIKLDSATMAYNHASQLPKFVPKQVLAQGPVLTDIEIGDDEYFLLYSEHQFGEQSVSLYLLSYAEVIESTPQESRRLGVFIFLFMAVLMSIFAVVLMAVSRRLVQPVLLLNRQLKKYSGDLNHNFALPKEASSEFTTLVEHLNHYRADKQKLLEREQAFARYTSHELRTPLTIIKGATSLLPANPNPEFQLRQQQRIINASSQMEETVEALLSLVRNERHELQEPLRTITTEEIQAIIDNNKPPALGNPVQISLQVDGHPTLKATQPLLAMVLGNLLRNAIGASSQGKIDVVLSSHAISIDDDGDGLGAKSKDGHGLGLMIVTDICQRYGWDFSLANLESGGCRAKIEFSTNAFQLGENDSSR